MFNQMKRLAAANSRKILTWKSVLGFVVATWTLRCAVVVVYCFFLHNFFFRFTSCPTEHHWPKNFSNIDSIAFGLEPTICENRADNDRSSMQIVVFVPVHVSAFERRRTIRDTWAKSFMNAIDIDGRRLITKLIFVVGSIPAIESSGDQASGESIDHRLKAESSLNNDILQLVDIVDAYYNITLKIRSVLGWTLKNCPRAAYVVRADSDVVLDYSNLVRFLFWLNGNDVAGAKNSEVIAGYCRPYDCVTRWPTSKTCLPQTVYRTLRNNDFDAGCFVPRYCFGFSYVLSTRFVEKALKLWSQEKSILSAFRVSMETENILFRYWPLDDVFVTGYVAEALDSRIPRLNHPQAFTYRTKFDTLSCHDNVVVASSAYEDEEEMRRRWAQRLETCRR